MAIDKVTSASIATDAVGPTQLNEASNYAFTGTVTGTPTGLNNAQMWYGTANTQLSSTHAKYTAWSAHNGSQIGSIGTALTVSSGDIQFPSTGIWLLKSRFTYYITGSGQVRYVLSQIRISTDSGSNYTLVDESINNLVNVNSGNNDFTITNNEYILDVTDASTTRAAFYIAGEDTSPYVESYNKATIFQALRLGDT